jgi:RimJ/RimL family protein N-acetyltransferase
MFIAGHCEKPRSSSGATSQRSWSRSIRAVDRNELGYFRDHLLRLGSGCRRSRFGNETTDAFLKGYAASVNHANTMVLGFFEAEQMRGTAELRSLREGWCDEAEAAFSVELPWQLRGIGTALMVETARAAHRRGVEHIYLSCHVRNRPMQRIAEKLAAKMRFEDDECLAHIRVRREPATVQVDSGANIESLTPGIVVIDL